MKRLSIVVLAVLVSVAALRGQGVTGSITGAVRDTSGAIVPNCSVTAESEQSGRKWQTVTNDAGIYNLPALPPDQYSLRVEISGFKRLVTNPITLEVNQTARVDLTLEVGAVAETIEVKSLAPLLQTESTQLGNTPATIDPKSLRDMTVMNAAYTYFIAAAGPAEKRWIVEVALTRGYQQMAGAADKILDQVTLADNADRLSRLLYQGRERLDYSLDRESQAVRSAWDLQEGLADLAAFAKQQKDRLERSIRDRAAALGLGQIQPVVPPRGDDHTGRFAPRAARELSGSILLGCAGFGSVLV